MKLSVLRSWKEHFWPTGAEVPAPEGPSRFNASEIDSLMQQLKQNSERAAKIRAERGHAVNPRIMAARKAGVNV